MTCVVAIVDDVGTVHMGSDSLASDTHSQTTMTDAKIFMLGEMMIGFAGSFRSAQIFKHALILPERGELQDDMNYLVTSFVNALRLTLLDAGALSIAESEDGIAGEFIIGYRGKIYRMQEDFSILHAVDDFISIGAGGESSGAVLYATKDMELKADTRIELSLKSAAYQITSVKAPFHFMSMTDDGFEQEPDEDHIDEEMHERIIRDETSFGE